MSDSKSKSNDADWGFAGFDFAKLIESCQISGVDMKSLIDTEKKNIDALIEVNRSAYDSWRNLMARQTEVFQETMKAIAAEAATKPSRDGALRSPGRDSRKLWPTCASSPRRRPSPRSKRWKYCAGVSRTEWRLCAIAAEAREATDG